VIIEGSRKQVIKYSCSNTIDKVSVSMPVLLSHCAACDAAHRRLLRRSKQVWPNPSGSKSFNALFDGEMFNRSKVNMMNRQHFDAKGQSKCMGPRMQ
jgi:hypothetical protein